MKKLLPILLVLVVIAAGYWVYASYFAFSDVTKPWWKGEKVVLICPEGDSTECVEVYASSNGTDITKANIYQEVLFASTECGEDENGRFCLVTSSFEDQKLRVTPHPTGKIDS